MAKDQEAAAAAEAEKHKQEALVATATSATAKAATEKAAAIAAKEKVRKGKEAHQAKVAGGSTPKAAGGIPAIAQHAQNTTLPEDHDD
jgi:hypothetical protein